MPDSIMPDSTILACDSCGTKNRVPLSRIQEKPICGKCGAGLPMESLGRVTSVTDTSFEKEVMGSNLPVLVDCWAPWCGPCRGIAPILEDLALAYAGRVRIVKLNLDENPGIGSRFAITSVPTLILVKNGQIVDTLVGALPKEAIETAIGRII